MNFFKFSFFERNCIPLRSQSMEMAMITPVLEPDQRRLHPHIAGWTFAQDLTLGLVLTAPDNHDDCDNHDDFDVHEDFDTQGGFDFYDHDGNGYE